MPRPSEQTSSRSRSQIDMSDAKSRVIFVGDLKVHLILMKTKSSIEIITTSCHMSLSKTYSSDLLFFLCFVDFDFSLSFDNFFISSHRTVSSIGSSSESCDSLTSTFVRPCLPLFNNIVEGVSMFTDCQSK